MTKKIKFVPRNLPSEVEPAPIPASKAIPDWFKKISPEFPGDGHKRSRGTVKRCLPYIDAMSSGYIAELPWDLEVAWVNGDQMVFWASNHTTDKLVDLDPPHRSKGLPEPYGYSSNVWRINLPSVTYTPSGHSILVTHPMNRYDLPFLAISGVVDSDKSHVAMTANVYIRSDFEGIIEKGTPVLQIIPFKRDNWNMETGEFDIKENIKHLYEVGSTLSSSYLKNFWSKKLYQ